MPVARKVWQLIPVSMRDVLFGVHATPRQAAEPLEWLRTRLRMIDFTEQEIDEFLVVGFCIKGVYDTLKIPPTCGRA